jgi:hypothetical protein
VERAADLMRQFSNDENFGGVRKKICREMPFIQLTAEFTDEHRSYLD